MKRHVGSGILILVILLAVGFATVATNLIINGQANINANTDDFDIYFTEASTDEGGTATIDPSNNKSITFVSKKLSFVGNSTELNYTVYNNSSQYDANVNVEFNAVNTVDGVDYSDYYTISFEGFDPTTSDHTTLMPGKTTKSGKITITLVQALLKEVEIKFTLTLVPSAVERIEEAVGPRYQIVSGDLDTVGSVVKIADEEFYVIGQEDTDHVKLLSKYNLGVGIGYDTPTNKQESSALGCPANPRNPSDGTRPADDLCRGAITLTVDNANDFINGLQSHVDNYVAYLNSTGADVSGRLITEQEMESLGVASYGQGSSIDGVNDWLFGVNFWTGTAAATDRVWFVDYDGGMRHVSKDYASASFNFGVRPVIILEK